MELSRDKVKEIINDDWLLMDDCEGNKNCDVVKELARITLASLEAEAVAWKVIFVLEGHPGSSFSKIFESRPEMNSAVSLHELGGFSVSVTPLYTAPPAPVSVPKDIPDSVFEVLCQASVGGGKACDFSDELWNACRAAMLQGADGSSLVVQDCSCRTCRPVTISDMRFVVCPECGNKRCPHANDHRNACTGSNEPGQEGSAYPAAPQQEA